MKLCIFSDIHGNGFSFRKAYREIVSEQSDYHIFLGDLCGYYYDQIEIFGMLMDIPNLIAVKGNHDQMFIDIEGGDEDLKTRYLNRYGLSMENLLSQDYRPVLDWLNSLPDSYCDPRNGYCCYHGSPRDPLEGYVYPDSPVSLFEFRGGSHFFLGHTHYKMNISMGSRSVINPGSMGQPRGNDWPTYALVELPSGRIDFKEVRYDYSRLIGQIETIGDDNRYLKTVSSRWPAYE